MPFEKGHDHGVRFGEGQDPTNGGRPKKIYTILKEQGYTKDDARTAFNELAWYTQADLVNLADDDSKPAIVRIVAKNIVSAITAGSYSVVKEILEQVIGKPIQGVDHTSQGDKINAPPIVFYNPDDDE